MKQLTHVFVTRIKVELHLNHPLVEPLEPVRYETQEHRHEGSMNRKAEALSAAKHRIVALQQQMTDRILKMAAEVEKLTQVVTKREAQEFLRVTCNIPSSELSTYAKFASTLKGHEVILEKGRASFPVVKALVNADDESRTEVLQRMEVGARISTKDIADIRRRLDEAKLTPEQVLAVRNGKATAAAARRRGTKTTLEFQTRLHFFVQGIIDIRNARCLLADDIRSTAAALRVEFEALFGADHRPPDMLKRRSRAYDIACAHFALLHLEEGTLGTAVGVGDWDYMDPHPWLISLQSLSGRASDRGARRSKHAPLLSPPDKRLTAVELCAGAGGMALGLERAGFEHVALVEFEPDAAATLRKNRPDWTVLQDDIKTIDFKICRELEVDLVCGGLPCQPYSIEGHGLGKDDPRDLLPEGVRIVDEIRPKAFLFENVEGLLHSKHSDHVSDILRGFRRAGYRTEIHRVQAADYGIAQVRRRVLLVGLRDDLADAFRMPPKFPTRRANIGDLLVDLMAANGWHGAHEWARQRREQPVLGRDGKVVAVGAQASTVVTGRGKRRKNEQAVQAAIGFDATGVPERAPTAEEAAQEGFLPSLTLRMRARIQDFPDDWEFVGGKQSTSRQIGNAVPPRLSQAVGLALHAAIAGVTWHWEAMLWPQNAQRLQADAPPLAPDTYGPKLLDVSPENELV